MYLACAYVWTYSGVKLICRWPRRPFLQIVSGITGAVGGEKVYSEKKLALAAGAAMAAYNILFHVSFHGFRNVCFVNAAPFASRI